MFARVWAEAQQLFVNPSVVMESCPVCETPMEMTHHRSRQAIASWLKENLDSLATYNAARTALKSAESTLQLAHAQLKAAIKTLASLLRAGKFEADVKRLDPFFTSVESWKATDALPNLGEVGIAIRALLGDVRAQANALRERQGDGTFAGAAAKIDELRRLATSIRSAQLERDELLKISASLERSALRIDKEIAAHVGSLLDGLREEINRVYAKIQGSGDGVPTIGLLPPDPEDKGQLKLDLVIDFADNRKGVNPAGYLSDSRVHKIALSLRLAAIKLFNPAFPFVVLDDIVTSYDADHRKALAAVMAEEFGAFQFILVTHDERFFRYLKEHMPAGNWIFRQITEIEVGYGPKYLDHKIADDAIDTKLAKGEHAANEIRQAEEEWLLQRAREFGVSVRIRDVDKPYSYERSEVAAAIASFLKERRIGTPVLAGFSNPLWTSLQAGEVENFGSHFQDNPNAVGSVGDELKRWTEFKLFRDLFTCVCGNKRFKRPKVGVDRPLCTKCEIPFAFAVPKKEEAASQVGTSGSSGTP